MPVWGDGKQGRVVSKRFIKTRDVYIYVYMYIYIYDMYIYIYTYMCVCGVRACIIVVHYLYHSVILNIHIYYTICICKHPYILRFLKKIVPPTPHPIVIFRIFIWILLYNIINRAENSASHFRDTVRAVSSSSSSSAYSSSVDIASVGSSYANQHLALDAKEVSIRLYIYIYIYIYMCVCMNVHACMCVTHIYRYF